MFAVRDKRSFFSRTGPDGLVAPPTRGNGRAGVRAYPYSLDSGRRFKLRISLRR